MKLTNCARASVRIVVLLAATTFSIAPAMAEDDDVATAGIRDGFRPVAAYTAVYELDGNVSGTITEMSRYHGGQVAQINDSQMKYLWRKQTTKNRIIIASGEVTIIDELEGTLARTIDPNYSDGMKAAGAEGVTDPFRAYMEGLGYVDTGEADTVLGEDCVIWENDDPDVELCMSDDGIMLRVEASRFGFDYIQRATEIRRGDPGPDEMFEVPMGLREVDPPERGAF